MAAQIRSKFGLILASLRARVQAVTGFPAERVLLTARDQLDFNPHGDQYVWLRPRQQAPDVPIIVGAGRVDARVIRKVGVTLRTRLATDESSQDALWLTDATLGHLAREHQLLDAFLMFQPVDAENNWLVTEPVRVSFAGQPGKDRAENEWGESTLELEVAYNLDLDQSYQ